MDVPWKCSNEMKRFGHCSAPSSCAAQRKINELFLLVVWRVSFLHLFFGYEEEKPPETTLFISASSSPFPRPPLHIAPSLHFNYNARRGYETDVEGQGTK